MEANVNAKDSAISTKDAVEVCNLIRKKTVQKSKTILKEIIEKKRAAPFRRFTDSMGHKKGIGPGKYPEKASTHILELLEQLELNAQNKNMDASSLYIKKVIANKGARMPRYGRHRGRTAKRTHIQIIAEEKKKPPKEKKTEEKKKFETKPPAKKEETKKETVKKETKKEEIKPEK